MFQRVQKESVFHQEIKLFMKIVIIFKNLVNLLISFLEIPHHISLQRSLNNIILNPDSCVFDENEGNQNWLKIQ